MKKSVCVLLGVSALALTMQAAIAGDELVTMRTLKVAGVEVRLPKTTSADGTICVSYLARASREMSGQVDLAVSSVCGKGVVTRNREGKEVEAPGGYTLRTVTNGDLSYEIPESAATRAQTEQLIPAGNGKKCVLKDVVITGNADVRCAG
ncbi:hypothetical protein [Burkholderia sp. Tr-20390]|uniref:hypothetical protein n=1 Tax=Burkholderia sp. Tr-20390 TaxID=2703904 RepID=UPI00197FEA13|nr:hypothetical protein [Burkholderia sp. Tr-20390]MBN3729415.1 hypothetical protein [Burkholderia sp. Tr-20390]